MDKVNSNQTSRISATKSINEYDKGDFRKEHTFRKENITEKLEIDTSKDYFKYNSENDKKYDFMKVSNFFYSYNTLKAFSWSVGIGSTFFVHRYLRTRNYKNAIRWGTATMICSYIFIFGSYELQPFMVTFLHSKKLERQTKEKLNKISYDMYRKNIVNSCSKYGVKVNNQIKYNSDFYARYYLFSVLSNLTLNDNDKINDSLNFNDLIKVKLRYNPFYDEINKNKEFEFSIDEDLGVEEDEEFYLSEINTEIGMLRNYKLVAVWIDYQKLYQSKFNVNLKKGLSLLKNNKSENLNNTQKTAESKLHFKNSDMNYLDNAISNAELTLNNFNKEVNELLGQIKASGYEIRL